jgi:hypothetical protein
MLGYVAYVFALEDPSRSNACIDTIILRSHILLWASGRASWVPEVQCFEALVEGDVDRVVDKFHV